MSPYAQAIAITIGVIAVLIALIGIGWRNRLRRQGGVAPLPPVPEGLQQARGFEGQYVCTTTAGDWLDRIAVHQLGIRTNASVSITAQGVLIDRDGAAPIFIGTAELRDVSRSSGMAGKFVEKDGLLVFTWMLGEKAVDTGFRPRYHQEMNELSALATDLLRPAGATSQQAPPQTPHTQQDPEAGPAPAAEAPPTPIDSPTDSPAAEKENQ